MHINLCGYWGPFVLFRLVVFAVVLVAAALVVDVDNFKFVVSFAINWAFLWLIECETHIFYLV